MLGKFLIIFFFLFYIFFPNKWEESIRIKRAWVYWYGEKKKTSTALFADAPFFFIIHRWCFSNWSRFVRCVRPRRWKRALVNCMGRGCIINTFAWLPAYLRTVAFCGMARGWWCNLQHTDSRPFQFQWNEGASSHAMATSSRGVAS